MSAYERMFRLGSHIQMLCNRIGNACYHCRPKQTRRDRPWACRIWPCAHQIQGSVRQNPARRATPLVYFRKGQNHEIGAKLTHRFLWIAFAKRGYSLSAKPRSRIKASTSTSRPLNALKPSAGSMVLPTDMILVYRDLATSLS